MKIFGLLFLSISTLGCVSNSANLVGHYSSNCSLHGENSLLLLLNEDGSFQYKLAHLDTKIIGTWSVSNDSLILESKYFDRENLKELFPESIAELIPVHKFTDFGKSDVYKIKAKKLYPLRDGDFTKQCLLSRN